MSSSAPQLRQTGPRTRVRAKPSTVAAAALPPVVQEVLRSPGLPLEQATRTYMEPRFGQDFSHVRVHTDSRAIESARAVQALAYTVGSSIVFGTPQHSLGSDDGRALLGHELAHTIQQGRGNSASLSSDPHGVLETSAQIAGHDVAMGRAASVAQPHSEVGLARAPDPVAERAKAVAEARAVAANIDQDEQEESQSAPAKSAKPGKFDPGGFGFKEADAFYRAAEDRIKLGELALTLAEKQAARHEFWDSNPSHRRDDARRAARLDLYWNEAEGHYIRADYVDQQEKVVEEDPEAKSLYSNRLWDLTENKPETKSPFTKITDVICHFTNPCSDNLKHFREDRASGMSREEAIEHGINRVIVAGGTMLIPGGPQGPIAIEPGAVPGGGVPIELPEGLTDHVDPVGDTLPPAETPASNTAAPKPNEPAAPPPPPPSGPHAVTPEQVRAAYQENPYLVKKSGSSSWHRYQWTANGGNPQTEQIPIAFKTPDGAIRVDEVRWLAVGNLSEINSAADMAPRPAPVAPSQKGPPVDPMGKTGEVVDPMGQTGAPPAPAPVAQAAAAGPRETQFTPPAQPAAVPVAGYTPVQPSVVVEAYTRNPDVLSFSDSPNFHEQVWRHGGGSGKPPVAFRVGQKIRVNVEAWPVDQRAAIGISMRLKP